MNKQPQRNSNTMKAAWKANGQAVSDLSRHFGSPLRTTTLSDDAYPCLLKTIAKPPPTLYYLGTLPRNIFTIAVVGSRKFSSYGAEAARRIVAELILNEAEIISGFAIGIDTIAHQACLSAHFPTWAVLPCGLDSIYPSSNQKMVRKIIDAGGGLISEYPPGSPALPYNFQARNRIISGLSHGVVVVEAALKSGTSITAGHALDQNREVFAVPGDIFRCTSAGCNLLIQKGEAKLITGAEAIISEFPSLKRERPKRSKTSAISNLPKNQQSIVECLSDSSASIDKLIRLTKLETNVVLAGLTEMELSGIVRRSGQQYYLLHNVKQNTS